MSFLTDAHTFLYKAEAIIPDKHRAQDQIDHLCYRASSFESYTAICQQAKGLSRFLTESDVNGRPISCFYVTGGLKAKFNTVHVIEIASPKAGTNYQEGFEHIEIFSANPEAKDLIIDEVKIKFCTESLLSIVQRERWEKFESLFHSPLANIFSLSQKSGDLLAAVHDSRVLEVLKDFHPKICGTYPLNIATSSSDIDIVCQIDSIPTTSLLLQKHFQKFSGFKISKTREAITCHFRCRDITIEIYGTNILTEKQRGYVHMLTEAQLLSYGGEWTRDKIIQLKKSGIKTEPAFAKLFEIKGDPYEELYTICNQFEKIELLAKNCLNSPLQ